MSAALNQSLNVDLGDRSYPIYIGEGLLSDQKIFQQAITTKQFLIVSNPTISSLYMSQVLDAFGGLGSNRIEFIEIPDGERYKNLETVGMIYDRLMELKFDRSCCLVALGGGVIGDMTGFAAATYQRGVQFIQLPTTLLAQVDSSVGGKTGVNHVARKNMIGAFHQPSSVIIDTKTLSTLPQQELVAGIAEVIKYGLIADREFLNWLADNMALLLAKNPEALAFAIHRSCENKAKVVASDEREAGARAALNLGHTFGHAFETATQYKYWLHGEAVGFGTLLALDLSYRMGKLSKSDLLFATEILRSAGLPEKAPPNVDANVIRELMMSDKKVKEGQLRLVLLDALGSAFITSDFSESQLQQTLSEFIT